MEPPLGFPSASEVGGRSFLLNSRREGKTSGQRLGFPARKKNRPAETDALWKRWKNQRAKAIFYPKNGEYPRLLLNLECPEKCPFLDFR
jgi:hypothetical protein